jgi:hypothetical protein
VVGSVALFKMHRAPPGTDIFNVAKALITAYFSMTMSSNILCSGELPPASHSTFPPWLCTLRGFLYATGAIAARIFFAWSKGNARPYWRIVVILVESSALYSLSVLAALVFFISGSNGQYPAVDAIVPLVVSPVLSPAHVFFFAYTSSSS